MTYENALRLADQTLLQLRRHKHQRAVWLIGDNITRTPTTAKDVAYMENSGAALVGFFNEYVNRQHLAEAIMEVAGEG